MIILFSTEAVLISIVLFLCIIAFGVNILIGKQIISQNKCHHSQIEKLKSEVLIKQSAFEHNAVEEEAFTKIQKSLFFKMNIIKKQCIILYRFKKQLYT
ncbi:MAG: hypothetical protein COW66_08915 [Flavobacteriaceae bacterium CG18_big_fil_WC_8_21_14_2_50_34_36]|nr:MAG: hypothetical protein COW66_08915 [Flavobacteriaceae bacterium CG18_big_fil_WC_8_21_14_2_50_34_36]PJC06847.1 MAG: hypothetical protein CO068_09135 [Flavobacteriaceae bacterium CG_4_9_14_0_8_um_filter_34_30]